MCPIYQNYHSRIIVIISPYHMIMIPSVFFFCDRWSLFIDPCTSCKDELGCPSIELIQRKETGSIHLFFPLLHDSPNPWLVVWIPEIPLWMRLLLKGTRQASPTFPNPKKRDYHQPPLPSSWIFRAPLASLSHTTNPHASLLCLPPCPSLPGPRCVADIIKFSRTRWGWSRLVISVWIFI